MIETKYLFTEEKYEETVIWGERPVDAKAASLE